MIWALLALLGVPIWLIVGLLIAVALRRHNFKKQPDVLACYVRRRGDAKWPRSKSLARQVHDVLVVNKGAAYFRTDISGVAEVDDLDIADDTPRKLVDPVGRVLTLDSGTRIEIAVSGADVERIDALAA